MTDVLFIQDLFYQYSGVMYLSAILKKNKISTDLLVEKNSEKILQYISFNKPKLVCFSVMTGMHKFPIMLSKKIKEHFPDIKILAGGPHPTFFPEYIQKGNFDAICIGEGDYVIKEYYDYVLDKQSIKRVPNIVFKKKGKVHKNPVINLVDPLDELPFPDRELYDKYRFFRNSSVKFLLSSRGCPFNCSFCYNKKKKSIYANKGKYLRFRSPENIVNEILEMKKRYKNLKTIFFEVDTFFCNKKWVINLLNLYAEKINLPFITSITANMIDDETGKLLKRANCKVLYFGIESGNEKIRKEILNKNISDEDIIKTAKILKKYNIKFRTCNMLGIPTETIDNMFETIYLNAKIHTDYPWCAIFTPYPGTELFEIAVGNKEIDKDFSFDDVPPTFMEKSILKRNDIDLIENIQKFFITGVKFPFLIPFIKKLIKLRPNIIFRLWFGLTYMISFMKSQRRSIFSALLLVLKNYVFFITRKNK